MSARRVLIAAGGTGGHMFPARATAEALIARGCAVRLISDARGLVHAADFPAEAADEIRAASPSTKNPLKLARAAVQLSAGVMQARRILRDWRPHVVAGFGGYPAFPALAAARMVGVRFAIHEQNAVLGRVNRVFAGSAAFVASGFARLDRAPAGARRLLTGNPVRAEIVAAREVAYAPPAGRGRIRLLVLGGSLGARILSETVPAAIARLPQALRRRLDVAQQTREESLPMARDVYQQAGVKADCRAFFGDVGERLASAHLVIARAGASSVSEIACAGRPAIFAPLAIAADDHQAANAEELVRAGAADSIREHDLTPEGLAELLQARLQDAAGLAARAAAARALGRPDAAGVLADALAALAGEAA
ncbi:MAG: undecaprenyldiphospho-muramoylpentapeptide beta-N-acetylglucosaminyltransferase [Maricaulaceae bacterium]|nr:undecaprenyldiphospho-muramoylpentapeptide beta-N-acetylglucosaminyltransferase [Maricaulaceae bacterium]